MERAVLGDIIGYNPKIQMSRPLTRTRSHQTSQALVALRQALGQTQQECAATLGLSVTTIARYETSREPDKKNLLRLAKLAEEHNRADLVQVFRRAISEPRTRVTTVHVLPGEEEDFEVLQMLLRNPAYTKQRAQWQETKDSVLDQQYERVSDHGNSPSDTAVRAPAPTTSVDSALRPVESLPRRPMSAEIMKVAVVSYTPATPETRTVAVTVIEPERQKPK